MIYTKKRLLRQSITIIEDNIEDKADKVEQVNEKVDKVNYDDYTVKQLVEIAKARGIEYKSLKKAELVGVLNG